MLYKKLWGNSCFDRYLFWMLIAIEILMSFTFFGYLHIPPISITIAYLPILAAGCLFGPTHAVIMALIFGFASMYKASASYVMPADAAFSPFLSGAPASSFMLSVGTRVLFGILIGIAFQAVRKSRRYQLWMGLISAVAPKVHSLIVYTAMGLLFPALGKHYYSAFHWKVNDTVIALICVVGVEMSWTIYQSNVIQNIRKCIDQSDKNPYASKKLNLYFGAFELFLICISVFAAFYFSQRESYMLLQHGMAVSDKISSDLLLLQVQFLFASLALNLIMAILLIATYKYMSYKEYRVELDALTGIMGRRMFLYHCDKALSAGSAGAEGMGWFLFADVDYFKSINDTFGHSAGDQVLCRIAQHLQHIFGEDGKVGRIGGDEFAVILEKPMTESVLRQRLEQFQKACSGTLPDRTVSCSIGAYQFCFPQNVERLLEETDAVLYQAKENGRACYVLKPCFEKKGMNENQRIDGENKNILIRSAKLSDYAEVSVLEEQVFQLHRQARPDYFKNQKESYSKGEFEELLALPCPISLTAVWDDAVVGICFGKIEETKENTFCKSRKVAYIEDLVVLPKFRGKGVATALMARAREQAAAEHAVSMELCVWNFNEQALRLYRSLGMEVQFLRLEEQLVNSENLP